MLVQYFLIEMGELALNNGDVMLGNERVDDEPVNQQPLADGPIVRIVVPTGESITSLALNSLAVTDVVDNVINDLKTECEKPSTAVMESSEIETATEQTSLMISQTAVISSKPVIEEMSSVDVIETESEQMIEDETLEEEVDTSQIKCEDCGGTSTMRKWRWCSKCTQVICEECGVGAHVKHAEDIQLYELAVRKSNEKIRLALEKARTGVKAALSDGNETLGESERATVAKFDRFKKTLDALLEQNGETHERLKLQMRKLDQFCRRGYGRDWESRQCLVRTDTQQISSKVKCDQAKFEKRMNELDDVNKMAGMELNTILWNE